MSSPFRLVLLFAISTFAMPAPSPKYKFSNITLDIALFERAADPINLPNLKLPSGGLPSVPGVAPTAAACPPTNNQSNQCSTGIPYCCSPDGDGGHVCQNGTVSCQQTVICCNNYYGVQICAGNIDFNMPVTINLNVNTK